ncbi:hypothetical protein K435DRAFT_775093 [Dendrothele bispora CBS 962.96]|uniref:TOM13-domain-containing protein n=1 Tax=Dendrothele bispora (strain CBS 962.96) TaxID=1314807 RepID=A0A4S8MKA2_DENBC|nr:hypothetical protein K435DRAFT_775093 [Dendrothele bispora CBS 962.96]
MADSDEQSLLEAALSESFSPPSLKRQSIPPTTEHAVEPEATTSSDTEGISPTPIDASHEKWKEEYEEQVKVWKSQSAEAREKAEKERARWESIRAADPESAHKKPPLSDSATWTTFSQFSTTSSTSNPPLAESPSPADARDLVTGESSKARVNAGTTGAQVISSSHSRRETGDDQKWEDLPSDITSSLPSMSFPESNSNEGSSPGHHDHERSPRHPPEEPVIATLSVFDSSLSTKTRLMALGSALAINLLLPFVNGVMLGFGEIFAKDVVLKWLGWKTDRPGSVSSTLGLRKSTFRRSKSDS